MKRKKPQLADDDTQVRSLPRGFFEQLEVLSTEHVRPVVDELTDSDTVPDGASFTDADVAAHLSDELDLDD